ncbi:MAG: acyl-CoA dehydrogenase protein [Mycobacterium sp.]|jgi:alkylation response protein AidB-like acyl-CoA dehydrogenase|nr:acyl-CoA dehydrogenase protein [Mycobacterium sp.]
MRNVAELVDPLQLPSLLQPSIEAASDEFDVLGDIPDALRVELRDVGAFRLLTPREFGGSETPLTDVLRIYEGFGRIDASIGWLVWNANFGFVGALLSQSGAAQIWAGGTEPVLANSGSPGFSVPADGGYQLSGQWKIVSGIGAADWFIAVGVVAENGQPRITKSGSPDIRLYAVRKDQLKIGDTWNVSGMRATGSNDVVVEDAFIPADLVTPPIDQPARIDRALYRGFYPALVFPGCSAVSLGVAQSAIDGMVTLASSKKAFAGGTVAESARTQYVIAKSETAVHAARLLLFSAADALQSAAEDGAAVTLEQRALLRSAMTHAAQVSREALVAMYELGSSSALYRGSALERSFRDGMVALQHANQSDLFLEAAGRVRLGLAPGLPLF